MNRRAFLGTLVGFLAAPRAAEAQQAGKIHRIGVLDTSPDWATITLAHALPRPGGPGPRRRPSQRMHGQSEYGCVGRAR